MVRSFVLNNLQDFYNFLLDSNEDPLSASTNSEISEKLSMKKSYPTYLSSKASSGSIDDLMNGIIKRKLKIIPKNVRWEDWILLHLINTRINVLLSIDYSISCSWGGQGGDVFDSLVNDFMRPRIEEVPKMPRLVPRIHLFYFWY